MGVAKQLLGYFTQYYNVVLALQQLKIKKSTKQFFLKTGSSWV